jgi:hypothetical protein
VMAPPHAEPELSATFPGIKRYSSGGVTGAFTKIVPTPMPTLISNKALQCCNRAGASPANLRVPVTLRAAGRPTPRIEHGKIPYRADGRRVGAPIQN